MEFAENLAATRILPVIVIKQLGHAVPLAKALVEGGLNILEIALRTDAALEALRRLCRLQPGTEGSGADVGLRPQQCRGQQQEGAYYARHALESLRKTGRFTPNSRRAKPRAFGYRFPGLEAIRAPQKRALTAPGRNVG